MAYEKRLCILKQIKKGFSVDGSALSGAVYAERLGQEVIITPKIAALAPLREGRYALALSIAGNTYCMELKGNEPLRLPETGTIKDGFAVLVCFVRGGEAEPLAFGFCGSALSSHEPLLRLFEKRERAENHKKTQEVQEYASDIGGGDEEAVVGETNSKREPERGSEPNCDPVQTKYDDEAIADTDYFGGIWEALEDAGASAQAQGEGGASEAGGCACADETGEAVHPFKLNRGGLTYYNEIAPKLKAAMQKYPRDEHLKTTFPNSDWVRAENALLGIIYAEGVPRYLCVAMKSEPPKEVADYTVFVPESPYTETEGYYVVFQDADSGDYVCVETA